MIGFVNTFEFEIPEPRKKSGFWRAFKTGSGAEVEIRGEPTRKCSSCKTHTGFSNTSLMDLYSSDEGEKKDRVETSRVESSRDKSGRQGIKCLF